MPVQTGRKQGKTFLSINTAFVDEEEKGTKGRIEKPT